MKTSRLHTLVFVLALGLALPATLSAQTLLNIDFGVGKASPKTGPAATGMGTNDYWNLYRHYEPKYVPGMALVYDGKLAKLKLADGTESPATVAVHNAPGVWGNASGDPMYDSYIFSPNGSNITVTLSGLLPGQYHFYLYGHADPDVTGEQNSIFTLRAGTNVFGPTPQLGGSGWKAGNPWQERAQYVVFREVPVDGKPVVIEVAPGPNGVAVLNGLQVLSRGTGPPRLALAGAPQAPPASTNLLFQEVRYDGKVSDSEARFAVQVRVESFTTNEISAPLFEGQVALVPAEIPDGLRIVSEGPRSRLFCAAPGAYTLKLDLVAKITRLEPWNQVTFVGPAAAIAPVTASAAAAGVEMQLLSGTQLEPEKRGTSSLSGFLGADRTLTLRWQGRAAEVARKSLVTVETTAAAQITPTVVKYTTALRYEILQAALPQLKIALPLTQALTKIQGEQIRDWQVTNDSLRQVLTVELIKPVEKSYAVTLFSEQTVGTSSEAIPLLPPQPMAVERESGSFTVSTDDTTVEIDASSGLRQVNAPAGAFASYRFNSRPVALTTKIQRIQPVIRVADRATARLEESRAVISHALSLRVEKAGIYALDLAPQPGFAVMEVKGEGIDDWKVAEGKLRISFASRVLGSRQVDIQLEQANREFPDRLLVRPLEIAGATNVTIDLGAAASPGIRLKTAELSGLREVPISAANRGDELLAFRGDQPGWSLALACEKLPPRVVAEVFDLVTIGDGLVGGSATLRYGIINQGVQQFRVAVPAHWKNLEFTGGNIRRKEQQTNVWTITLQDKAWGGYTLVLTYDYQFDPKGGTLDLAGAHPLDVERETGSLGLMTAASLRLTPAPPADPLRRVDEVELSPSDRALCTRPLLLAYKYTGGSYRHSVEVARFDEEKILEAVADRTELTTVLTEEGQLLTQSSFMVKNNEKQFQKFRLPKASEFWSSYVNGQPAKPERDGDWLLVPLPRDANRDQAFAVDIVYAQKVDLKGALLPRRVELAAPLTDIPNTYAEWQLFVPVSQRLTRFAGNMTVARGATYGLHDAWQGFVQFYGSVIDEHLGAIVFCFAIAAVLALIVVAARRGARAAVTALLLLAIVAILAAMMLPALSRAKSKAQRISAVNNLKQVGLAVRTWAQDNGDMMPTGFEAMKSELGSDKVTYDPSTGQRFVYVGAGKSTSNPEAIVAYSPSDLNGRAVVFADGSVQVLNAEKFQEALQRDAALPRAVISANVPAAVPATTMERMAEVAQAVEAPAPAAARRFGAITVAPAAAQPPAMTGLPRAEVANGMVGGGGGGVGGAQSAPVQAGALALKPTAAGVRPIRIEVPRTGQAFNFTKVLNTGQEPLNVSMSMMRVKVYRAIQMVVQVCAFVIGLAWFWWLAFISERRTLRMALAASLVLWAVASLLMMWRLLHIGMILAAPALLAGLVVWAGWNYWQRRKARRQSDTPDAPQPPIAGGEATGTASLVLLLFAGALAGSARAQEISPPTVPSAVSIVSAAYQGAVREKVAQLDVSLRIFTAATNQLVNLFGDDVAIESFSAPGGARLVRDGNAVGVLIPNRGAVTLQFKLVARLGGDVTRRQLAFAIPPALSSRVDLTLDEAEADVEFPTAVSFQRSSANQQTRVEAVIGPGGRLELNWTPRVKRAAEIAATVFAQNTALATLGDGVINIRATLAYQVSQGELKQLRVRLPAGQRLLRVNGDAIRVWEIKDDVLQVELLKSVSPEYRLELETEKVMDKLPATLRIEIPHALDVKRETGLVALRAREELSVTVEDARDLQRVDAEEFHRAAPDLKDGLLSAFRFQGTEFALAARAETVRPQIEAVVRNQVRLGTESVRVEARIDYVIKRAGVFALRVALPAAFRVESVAGTNLAQWIERADNGGRLVEVSLKERTVGAYGLTIALVRNYAEVPKSLPVEGVHPLDAQKLSGFITVATELGLAAKTASFEGLTEVPFASVSADRTAAGGSALAYKFLSPAPGPQPDWRLTVATETVDPWLRAEVVNTITLTETLVSGRTLVNYGIANAPVKEFRLRVPAAFKNIEITGSQIRRRDQTNEEWRVELQNKVQGAYLLTVTWELPRSGGSNLVELAGVQALRVERETGFLALVAKPPLQVSDKSASELLSQVDLRELPAWAGRPDPATVLGYRYLRPGYKLAVEARRFDEAEVLQALIDSARLATVVADDGQMMTEMTLSIRNNGRQHLEMELPEGATVWSAFVAGDPVRPGKREGRYLLPLAREVASDAPVAVELTFVSGTRFPRRQGTISLVSPRFDVPMKNARWDLYLPPDYEYSGFQGSMSRGSDAAMPMVQVFSLSEYNVQQRALEEQKLAELKSELTDARKNLDESNLRQAVGSYNRAKYKGQQLKESVEGDKDLKDVEQVLRRAQGSNLLNAQSDFYFDNAGRLADAQTVQAQQAPAMSGRAAAAVRFQGAEVEIAGQQWDKLERAQQVALAKISPLRVNLPTRGAHYSFAQVLQTEIRKPMTIRLHAENTKLPNWFQRTAWMLIGFAVLWAAIALVARKRPANP